MARRPDPKELLDYIKNGEKSLSQGKLKIFLGAAPGVGKTYSMLQESIARQNGGLNVLAGVVETHGRKETEAMLNELQILAKKLIDYKGKKLKEFDLDMALTYQGYLVLVDELAHANVPGSRHNKRWQDVMELLDRGIDVYTTLNVQHIESLNNQINQITGITIRETVPDTVLERANSIELIDLPPEDLIKRLNEGKIYVPTDTGIAIDHFFRKGNLIALREIALRYTADRVDTEVLFYRRGELIEKIWPTKERLLVCIGPDQNSSKLIRAAYRIAKSLRAEWIVIFVDTPYLKLSEDQHRDIIQNLHRAEQLGGKTLVVNGTDVVTEVINYARDRNVTKIILAKTVKSRWRDFFSRSLADEFVRSSDDIDLYILRDSVVKEKSPLYASNKNSTSQLEYLISIATVGLCSAVGFLLSKYLEFSSLVMIYFLGVIFISARGYLWPSVLASILSVLFFYFFFVPPVLGFAIPKPQHLITLVTMLLVSQVIAHLTTLTRQQAKFSRAREQKSTMMHLLSKQLASTRGVNHLLEIALSYISDVFNSEVLALLPDANQHLQVINLHNVPLTLSPKEQSVAQWVYELGQTAGLGTETLPDNEAVYIPLLGTKNSLGVLRILPKDPTQLLIPEQLHLLEGISNQTAMALEVDRLQEEAKKTELQIETDRVRNVLLKYVCDNMHAPLVDIMNLSSNLIEIGQKMNLNAIEHSGNSIYINSEELNHSINNLSQLIRLETTEITLTRGLHSLEKVVNIALKSLNRKLANKTIRIHSLESLPKISFNKVFLEQVFYNIIENAIKYTPAESPIEIYAELYPERVIISIEDHGPGVALEEMNKIFEKFYRSQAISHIKGMGLGLTISQKIIHLHGGEIWAENRKGGGAIFRFTLPLT